MQAVVKVKEAVCDVCRRLFKESRKRYHCDHCRVYYYVCNHCKDKTPKCPHCGVILERKSAPLLINNRHV